MHDAGWTRDFFSCVSALSRTDELLAKTGGTLLCGTTETATGHQEQDATLRLRVRLSTV